VPGNSRGCAAYREWARRRPGRSPTLSQYACQWPYLPLASGGQVCIELRRLKPRCSGCHNEPYIKEEASTGRQKGERHDSVGSSAFQNRLSRAYSLQTTEPCRTAILLVDHFKRDRRGGVRLSFSQRLNSKKLLPVERGGFCQDCCERCPLPLPPAVA
jgi:hypothetical protein